MMVRCGACRTQFDVPGAGRFACPVCGSVNVVREQPGAAPASVGGYPVAPGAAGGQSPAAPTPPPNRPSPRVTCSECGFAFIVGEIALATCPNCGAEVRTGLGSAEEE
jgi:LSD1 subclass zinc finger protein